MAATSGLDRWFVRNTAWLKTAMRVVFGAVWLIDGTFKFSPGMPEQITGMIQSAGQGNPSWLLPWFNFWYGVVSQSPAFWVYFTGTCEVLLGLALIFGFVRKPAYLLGILLSLFIWAVPEGLGGPYGPSSTDIGTGIIYAFVFIFLLMIEATYGTSKYSLDRIIEGRVRWWKEIAELKY